MIVRRICLPLLAFAAATPAEAHSAASLTGGFHYGFLHPFSGPDHLLAMVSVGLWGAILGRPLIYVLPTVFPIVMAMGGVAGILGLPMLPIEYGIAASVIVLGGAIAAQWAPPVWLAALLVAFFAVFHGYAHGAELPSIANPIGYSAGFVVATGLLHLCGIAIGAIDTRPGGRTALRLCGAAIMLVGFWFAWRAIAG